MKFSALAGEIMADSMKHQVEGKLHGTAGGILQKFGQIEEVLGC
jgi:hypothetical protein